jgi:uncharacterized protein YoaH (UPF0181 family)
MRAINNHEQIQHIVEKVGEYIAETISDENIDNIPVAKELLLQVDGGHIKDKTDGQRSFEAMMRVIYKPENIVKKGKSKDNILISKHCAESALDDEQEYMKKATLIAAKNRVYQKKLQLQHFLMELAIVGL